MSNRTMVVGAVCALIGCAVGVTARHEAIAEEPKPATIRRWQQECVSADAPLGMGRMDRLKDIVRTRGMDGWELVAIETDNHLACFKRPLD